jgi:hypothetical protein
MMSPSLTETSRRRRVIDRLGLYGTRVLLLAVIFALIGGVGAAFVSHSASEASRVVDECESPPCFGGGGAPRFADLPVVLPSAGYGISLLFGLPSMLLGGWELFLRRNPRTAARLSLLFLGPLLVFVGTEVIPHLLSPCAPAQFGLTGTPGICERSSEGIDVTGQWHPLTHALLGALPMMALYWSALRRWRPDISERVAF